MSRGDKQPGWRSRWVLGLSVGLVVGLGVGSVGTAVAGPSLTKKAVKKIATKVVATKAPTLSVAHAATAGDAATLDGLGSSALTTAVYRYTLPVEPMGGHNYTFPGLPPGTYLMSYSLIATSTSPTDVIVCNFADSPHWFAGGQSYGAHNGSFVSLNGVTTETADSALQLHCGPTYVIDSSDVSFMRVDTVTTGTPTG